MPFFSEKTSNCKPCKKSISSLQVHSCPENGTLFPHTHLLLAVSPNTAENKTRYIPEKRVSHCISPYSNRGSMTLEAVMIVPLFLFVILNLYAAVNLIALHVRLEAALHQTALPMAKAGYAYQKAAEGCGFLESEFADIGFSFFYVGNKVRAYAGEGYLDRIGIQGGAEGVSFLRSDITDSDYLDLIAVYHTRALFLPESISSFQMVNRVRLKKWTGYDNTGNAGTSGEQTVYVAEHESVYHATRDCSHLKLSVSGASWEELEQLRNKSGSAYSVCELCGEGGKTNGIFYITDEGLRYHTSLSCSGLKRTVYEIPASQAGALSVCSRCGG